MISSDRLETLMKQAKELLLVGKDEKAIISFEISMQISLRNINGLKYYEQVLLEVDKYNWASALFHETKKINPTVSI
jgi:hypothetical protein